MKCNHNFYLSISFPVLQFDFSRHFKTSQIENWSVLRPGPKGYWSLKEVSSRSHCTSMWQNKQSKNLNLTQPMLHVSKWETLRPRPSQEWLSCNIPECFQSSLLLLLQEMEAEGVPDSPKNWPVNLIVYFKKMIQSKLWDSLYTYMKGESPSPFQGDSKLSVYGRGFP